MNSTYIVAGSKPWNRRVFDEVISINPGNWYYYNQPKDLDKNVLAELNPRYIFFMHWSWIVPLDIIQNFECVCFHMTDVPYGRGGSPLQNLIIRGHQSTKLTALRMVEPFDAGPVYFKKDLQLCGGAEEIYIRASYLTAEMILELIEKNPEPQEQEGEPTIFSRRKPNQSEIKNDFNLYSLYDFIRMLDAEGYPKAFFNYSGFRYEFSRALIYNGKIVADVKITPIIEDEG